MDLVNDLIREGAHVTAYDPKGNERVQELSLCPGVRVADSALEAVRDAETLVLATEWPEFAAIDLVEVYRRMHTPIVFDGRNLFDPNTMTDLGFQYYPIGRPPTKVNSQVQTVLLASTFETFQGTPGDNTRTGLPRKSLNWAGHD